MVSRSVDRRESGSHRVIALQRRTSLESQKILPAQDVERVKVCQAVCRVKYKSRICLVASPTSNGIRKQSVELSSDFKRLAFSPLRLTIE